MDSGPQQGLANSFFMFCSDRDYEPLGPVWVYGSIQLKLHLSYTSLSKDNSL